MNHENHKQDDLRQITEEYMSQSGHGVEELQREKQKLIERLENIAPDDDIRREALKTTISHLEKTMELIGSISRRACGLIAWEDEKS